METEKEILEVLRKCARLHCELETVLIEKYKKENTTPLNRRRVEGLAVDYARTSMRSLLADDESPFQLKELKLSIARFSKVLFDYYFRDFLDTHEVVGGPHKGLGGYAEIYANLKVELVAEGVNKIVD